MEIEPKPVITPVNDASLTVEPIPGRKMTPACQCQSVGERICKGPLPRVTSESTGWPGFR